jgi:hypothetical protein
MVTMTRTCLPSQPDGSGSIVLTLFNIRSGHNGGLEAALRAMDQLGVDIGFLVETKLMGGIYTRHSLGYDVLALTAMLLSSGGIALFWRGNTLYEVEETQIWGPNVISLHVMMGSSRSFVMGCYIPPSNLETLACINKAWHECPKGAHPILVGDLNLNLRAPHMEREETIAKQVDAINLVDMSRHFCQRLGNRLWGRWTWRMRREGRWISSQCNYFLGRETDHRRFRRVSVRMPCYHSDHSALVAVIYAEGGEELKRYCRRMQQFPLSLPRGPRTQLDSGYKELLQHVVCPPPRERPANKWITDATWKVVNYCAMLRRKGMISQAAARNLGQKIKACLKADCLTQAATTASNVEGCLAAGEYIEAWRYLKGWYRLAEDRAPKPCLETLAKQTEERIQLYTAVPPPGWAMRFNVDPSDVPDVAPTDSELRAVVGNLRNCRAAGATGMKAKHLKEWLADMKRQEAEDGVEGIGDRWRSFVTLLQAVWESGTIPTQMTWMIIVLYPKGGGDYCSIGLLDPICKVMEKVMVAQFSVIKLHDCIHGGLPCRGRGTAIMEVKLQQQLAWVDQEPLY